MVGVEVEDADYVESDAEEFVSHIETAVSEVAPFRGTVVSDAETLADSSRDHF